MTIKAGEGKAGPANILGHFPVTSIIEQRQTEVGFNDSQNVQVERERESCVESDDPRGCIHDNGIVRSFKRVEVSAGIVHGVYECDRVDGCSLRQTREFAGTPMKGEAKTVLTTAGQAGCVEWIKDAE